MAKSRSKQPKKLESNTMTNQPKQITIDEIKFIITNASELTVPEMAEKTGLSVEQIYDFINTYNSANKHMVRDAFGRHKGSVVMTEASSSHGDKIGSPFSFIKPKPNEPHIFRMKK